MSLKSELFTWIEENTSESSDFSESLWEFLESKMGPVQEKLLNDITVLRFDKQKLERKLEVLASEFKKTERGNNLKNS